MSVSPERARAALSFPPEGPTVREVDGLLDVTWPEGRPNGDASWFAISDAVFANLVDEVNRHRRAGRP